MSETLKLKQPRRKSLPKWPKLPVGNLLTPSAVAKKLAIHRSVMQRLIDLGEIQTVIFAGFPYIPQSEVERLQKLLSGEVSE